MRDRVPIYMKSVGSFFIFQWIERVTVNERLRPWIFTESGIAGRKGPKGVWDSLFQAVLFETVHPFSLTNRFWGRGGREVFFPIERIIETKIRATDSESDVIGDFLLGANRR
jgi:hypothetical protein